MSLLTCGGVGVEEAIIAMPRIGVWTADLKLDTPDPSGLVVGASAVIDVVQGTLQLTGTLRASGGFIGSQRVRMVGGAGGLSKAAAPKFYQQSLLRDVLNDLLGTAGESLSSTASTGLLGTSLQRWTTMRQPIGSAIAALAAAGGAATAWRVLADGTVWIGPETWPAIASSYDFIVSHRYPQQRRIEIAAGYPFALPGQQLVLPATGEILGNVSYVEHIVTAEEIRSTVLLE